MPALQAQLVNAGVAVLTSSCGNTGLGYPAVCGGPNGEIGISEINASQSSQAQALGFAPLSTYPNASARAC